jgi:tight adherence protein C
MSPTLLICLVAAGAGLTLLVVAAVQSQRVAPDFGQFFEGLDYEDAGLEHEKRLSEPLVRRTLRAVAGVASARVERLVPATYLATVDRRLGQAGMSGKRGAGQQVAMQIGLAVAGAAVGPWVPTSSSTMRLMALVLLPVMGFMLPAARLKRAISTRSEAIFKDLPDIVDMLAIAVEAGSGFESALQIVCSSFNSPLADELMMALQEMELGLPRRVALQQLRDRVDLDVVRTLILALLQADALGIPIGRVLKTQAAEVRARRRSWAREKAAKLPVKIMFPLVLFIFPPIMAIVIGPAASSFGKL